VSFSTGFTAATFLSIYSIFLPNPFAQVEIYWFLCSVRYNSGTADFAFFGKKQTAGSADKFGYHGGALVMIIFYFTQSTKHKPFMF